MACPLGWFETGQIFLIEITNVQAAVICGGDTKVNIELFVSVS